MLSTCFHSKDQVTEYALIGENSPTFILESGLGDSLKVWERFVKQNKTDGIFLLYNRSGYGKSISTSPKRDSQTIARELHTLIQGLNLKPPFILIAHSLGCAYAQTYAAQHQDEVGGLLLIDPMTYEMDDLCEKKEIKEWKLSKFRKFVSLIFLKKGGRKELKEREGSLEQASRIKNLRIEVPAAIITAGKGMSMWPKDVQHQWLHSHELLGQRFSSCIHKTAENSGHHVQLEHPELISQVLGELLHVVTANMQSKADA